MWITTQSPWKYVSRKVRRLPSTVWSLTVTTVCMKISCVVSFVPNQVCCSAVKIWCVPFVKLPRWGTSTLKIWNRSHYLILKTEQWISSITWHQRLMTRSNSRPVGDRQVWSVNWVWNLRTSLWRTSWIRRPIKVSFRKVKARLWH